MVLLEYLRDLMSWVVCWYIGECIIRMRKRIEERGHNAGFGKNTDCSGCYIIYGKYSLHWLSFLLFFFLNQETVFEKNSEPSETDSSGLQVAIPFWSSSLTMTRPPTGKRLPACCYGANNKLEAMHSSS